VEIIKFTIKPEGGDGSHVAREPCAHLIQKKKKRHLGGVNPSERAAIGPVGALDYLSFIP